MQLEAVADGLGCREITLVTYTRTVSSCRGPDPRQSSENTSESFISEGANSSDLAVKFEDTPRGCLMTIGYIIPLLPQKPFASAERSRIYFKRNGVVSSRKSE